MLNKDGFAYQKTSGAQMAETGHGSGNNGLVIIDQKRRRVQEDSPLSEDETDDMVMEAFGPKNGEMAGLALQARLDK